MIGAVRSRISRFMNAFGTLGYMKCTGKTAIAKLPSNVVLHDKSEIGDGLLPIVAKPEGEVICTYPPFKQSEPFYTDLAKQVAQD
jgi:hypothetical protein